MAESQGPTRGKTGTKRTEADKAFEAEQRRRSEAQDSKKAGERMPKKSVRHSKKV